MRITIILGPFYPVPTVLGGAVEKVQLQLAEAYARAGHSVTMVSRQFGDFPQEGMLNGVRHIRIPSTDRGASLIGNLVRDLPYALRAARAMPVSDITVTNSFFLPLVLPRAKAGKIYVHVARYPKRQFLLYGRAGRLQAVSKAVGQAVAAQAPRLASKVRVIGNPIAASFFPQQGRPEKQPVVLYVGRIAREKNLHVLIGAFRMLSQFTDWKLCIVGPHAVAQGGDGEAYLDELKTLAEPLQERCEFTGPIFDKDRLIENYRSAAIFVYPTAAAQGEALPLAPLEAMANGCAVVLSELDCFKDYAQHERNALIFDHRGADTETNLAQALERLIQDDGLRANLGTEAMKTAHQFSGESIANKMLADFESLLNPAQTGHASEALGSSH